MKRRVIRLPYIIFLVVLLSYSGFLVARQYGWIESATDSNHVESIDAGGITKVSGPPLSNFMLTDSNGEPFESESLAGKVWIGSFFFTNCPGSCWKMNQKVQELQENYKDADVTFVSITCDPDNDTIEALDRYAKHFKAQPGKWHFLRGDLELVQRIGRDMFKLPVERQTHSDRMILFDRDGNPSGGYLSTDDKEVERLCGDIAKLLDETPTP